MRTTARKTEKKMRKLFAAGIALLAAVVLMFSLAGCGGGVTVNYSAVEWKGDGAKIYDGETLVGETVTNAYLLRLAGGEHTITLKRGDKQFASFSYTVPTLTEKVYKSAAELETEHGGEIYFNEAEHLVLDFRGSSVRSDAFSAPVHLASNVKKVSVLADSRFTLTCSFIIQQRADDITFEFERIVLFGLSTEPNAIGYADGATPQGKLILSFFGVGNSVSSGFAAKNGRSGSDKGWIGTGGNGENGENGGCAVKGGEIVILSETDVAFNGTNGGNGGNGGDATVLAKAGNGGNGGNGGAAIEGTSVTLFMVEGVFTATAGTGGKAGSAGGRALGGAGSNGKAGTTPAGVTAETKDALRGSFNE